MKLVWCTIKSHRLLLVVNEWLLIFRSDLNIDLHHCSKIYCGHETFRALLKVSTCCLRCLGLPYFLMRVFETLVQLIFAHVPIVTELVSPSLRFRLRVSHIVLQDLLVLVRGLELSLAWQCIVRWLSLLGSSLPWWGWLWCCFFLRYSNTSFTKM